MYGLTSHVGTSERAATKLLALVRGHWKVESNHWIRDVTFDEDRSQIRKGNGPQVMATLRNLAVSLIGLAGGETIAKTTRWLSRRAEACFRLIGYPAPQ